MTLVVAEAPRERHIPRGTDAKVEKLKKKGSKLVGLARFFFFFFVPNTDMHVHVYAHAHIHAHMCVSARMHTHTQTNTHTWTRAYA